MKLLIVDDQIKVVQGLLEMVDWRKYGIDEAFGAFSSAEAQQILSEHHIDVLLSDIEMPSESGLSLVTWMKKQEMETRCILLTAHANFNYAQESVRLGIFDYVLQPATYQKIASVVERAVRDVQESAERKHLASIGKELTRMEAGIVGGTLRAWLNGQGNKSEISMFQEMGKLPEDGSQVTISMLQILSWTRLGDWTPALLAAALQNVMSEVFMPYGRTVLVAATQNDEFVLLFWENGESISNLDQPFHFLLTVCRQYFDFSACIYSSGQVPVEDIVDVWNALGILRDNNVTREEKVFHLKDGQKPGEGLFRLTQVGRWAEQLKGEFPRLVGKEACAYLDDLSAAGKLNARTLRDFYQDFLQAFHIALGTDGSLWRDTLGDPHNYEIYRNGIYSVEQMKELINFAVSHMDRRSRPPEQELVEKIDRYIDTNLEMDIRRSDLATQLYLNPDYLNRIFKQITGHSLKEYVILRKMEAAKTLLLTTRLPISIVAAKVGYDHLSHFSTSYKKVHGITPMKTRQEN